MSTRVRIDIDNPPMALEFHPSGHAVYVRLSAHAVVRTVALEQRALADYDEAGELVGLELLGLGDPDVGQVLTGLKDRFAAEAPALRSVEAITA